MKTSKLKRRLIGRNGNLRDARRRGHINRCGRAFLPQSRIRKIRFEEAVVHSRAKREGKDVAICHFDCHCGSIECLGTAIPRILASPPAPTFKPEKEAQLTQEEYFIARYGTSSNRAKR